MSQTQKHIKKSSKCLIIGHGPSKTKINDLNLDDYNEIITCHDHCGLLDIPLIDKSKLKFTICEAEKEKQYINYLSTDELNLYNNGQIKLFHIQDGEHPLMTSDFIYIWNDKI